MHASDLHSKRLAREYGLTTPQIVVLQSIRELGETTTSALSAHISLSQATVTTILDRLAQRELIERYRSVVDRRVVHTRLTSTGQRVLKRVPPLLHWQFVNSFSALRVKDQRNIVQVLEQVASMLAAETGLVAPASASPSAKRGARTRPVEKLAARPRSAAG
jgi:DNA-binding MarR family transcriptional regulator